MNEDAERKRVFDEMMARVNAQNEITLKYEKEQEEKKEINKQNIIKLEETATKRNVQSTVFLLAVVGLFTLLPAYIINSIFSINLYPPAIIIFGLFLIFSLIISLGTNSTTSYTAPPPQKPHMKCPHCGKIGFINTKKVDFTKGISGGKAVAGLLTGGLSILAVGISRQEEKTEAHCQVCKNTWHF